jgi:phage terminase small subunit
MATAEKKAETYDGSTPLPNYRHELFCLRYLIHSDGKKAYIEAGYSEKGAAVSAHRLLTDANYEGVQRRIRHLRDQRIKASLKSSTEVLKEVEKIAFSDPTNVVTWNESGMCFVKSSDKIHPDHSAAIESIEVTEKGAGGDESDGSMVIKTKVKHHNKLKALELLGKEHGLFKEKVEHSGNVSHTIEVVDYGNTD